MRNSCQETLSIEVPRGLQIYYLSAISVKSVDKVERLSGEIVTLYDCSFLPLKIYSSTKFGLF